MRLKKNLDLVAAVLVAVLNVGWVQLLDRSTMVSIILALPLVFLVSGYTFTQVLFRKKSRQNETRQKFSHSEAARPDFKSANPLKLGHPIGRADQLILSLGLSMAIDILVGFSLNMLPIGLQPLSWTLSLGLLTVLFAAVAWFLRRKDDVTTTKMSPPRITLPDILFLLLAAFIIGNSIWLAVIRPSQPQASFTQFWMLPADQANKTCAVSLGVQSFELDSASYTITMTVNNARLANSIAPIVLAPQQKWVQTQPIPPEGQNDLHVEAQLYQSAQPYTFHREVHLTFHVAMVDQNGLAQPECTLGT